MSPTEITLVLLLAAALVAVLSLFLEILRLRAGQRELMRLQEVTHQLLVALGEQLLHLVGQEVMPLEKAEQVMAAAVDKAVPAAPPSAKQAMAATVLMEAAIERTMTRRSSPSQSAPQTSLDA